MNEQGHENAGMAKRTPKKKSPKQVETWGCLERMIQMTTRSKCVLWLVIAFAIGIAVGAGVSQFLDTDSSTQPTSLSRLQPPNEVIEEITQILDQCEPDQTFSNEDDFGNWLFDYLREHSDYTIEAGRSTEFGIPDILVENALAIELKKKLTEQSKQDRCVAQCIRYTQRWYTMLVLLDTPASEVHDLDTLLDLAGLADVPVFELSSANH